MKCGLIRYLSNDVSELMDVGDTRAKLFAKLGIRKFKDLLFHLPTDYIDRRYSPNIYEIKNGDLVALEVEVFEINIKTSFRHKSPSKILCKKCAMKVASGGKCKNCKNFFVECKRN